MEFEQLKGKRVLAPPGFVGLRLPPALWLPYKRLHQAYGAYLTGMPMLSERDFDGKRMVKMTSRQLKALNEAFTEAAAAPEGGPRTVFEAQEDARTRLFKRLQYLS